MILSASRRTDIPAYYSDWFLNRLREGYALTRNPMNRSQISKVVLTPEVIDCIVFWTKDPSNMMDKLKLLDEMGYHYYFQFTLTPYGKDIERNLRPKADLVSTFRQLSETIGKEKVIWRYDPILLNNRLTIEYHLDQFNNYCRELQGYTESCIISFVDLYSKLNKPVKEHIIREITEPEIERLSTGLSDIGNNHGIELKACSEQMDLLSYGIKPASCIDKQIVEQVCGHEITAKKDRNQRPGCNCLQSVDIGAYNTCRNGCIYCYANHSAASIEKNCSRHDPNSDMLIPDEAAQR